MAKIMIGEYEGSIYPDGNGYRGAIDLGFDAKGRRHRVKRRGRTKAEVKDKLKEAVAASKPASQPTRSTPSKTPSTTSWPRD